MEEEDKTNKVFVKNKISHLTQLETAAVLTRDKELGELKTKCIKLASVYYLSKLKKAKYADQCRDIYNKFQNSWSLITFSTIFEEVKLDVPVEQKKEFRYDKEEVI